MPWAMAKSSAARSAPVCAPEMVFQSWTDYIPLTGHGAPDGEIKSAGSVIAFAAKAPASWTHSIRFAQFRSAQTSRQRMEYVELATAFVTAIIWTHDTFN